MPRDIGKRFLSDVVGGDLNCSRQWQQRLWCFSFTPANGDTRVYLVLDPLANPCPRATAQAQPGS